MRLARLDNDLEALIEQSTELEKKLAAMGAPFGESYEGLDPTGPMAGAF
ncbi:MAG: hypothetical protein V3V67_05810 [Myxococcota bacterium]